MARADNYMRALIDDWRIVRAKCCPRSGCGSSRCGSLATTYASAPELVEAIIQTGIANPHPSRSPAFCGRADAGPHPRRARSPAAAAPTVSVADDASSCAASISRSCGRPVHAEDDRARRPLLLLGAPTSSTPCASSSSRVTPRSDPSLSGLACSLPRFRREGHRAESLIARRAPHGRDARSCTRLREHAACSGSTTLEDWRR